jgi:hypothetical protein
MDDAGSEREAKHGALNRAVRIAVAPGAVRAVVEDDFHHFRVALRHSAGSVTEIETESFRFPYSLCPDAGGRLRDLIGAPLTTRASEVFKYTNARLQCTHQFDLAALAIAAAARQRDVSYRAHVPDFVDRRSRATLSRRGACVLAWDVEGYALAGPDHYAGRDLGAGFTDWVANALDEDEAEAALVLRRAVFVSRGRRILPELNLRANARGGGGCWVQQPGRAEVARREHGSWRDFSSAADSLTASDGDWLAFSEVDRG